MLVYVFLEIRIVKKQIINYCSKEQCVLLKSSLYNRKIIPQPLKRNTLLPGINSFRLRNLKITRLIHDDRIVKDNIHKNHSNFINFN